MKINLIVSVGEDNVIGCDGKQPWYIKEDLKHFKKITGNNPVVMGRKTHEAIGYVLKNRINIVVSSGKPIPGCVVIKDPRTIFDLTFDEIFIIGGEKIYEYFLPIADVLYVTHVYDTFKGDRHFPEIDLTQWVEVSYQDGVNEESELKYGFSTYTRSKY